MDYKRIVYIYTMRLSPPIAPMSSPLCHRPHAIASDSPSLHDSADEYEDVEAGVHLFTEEEEEEVRR